MHGPFRRRWLECIKLTYNKSIPAVLVTGPPRLRRTYCFYPSGGHCEDLIAPTHRRMARLSGPKWPS